MLNVQLFFIGQFPQISFNHRKCRLWSTFFLTYRQRLNLVQMAEHLTATLVQDRTDKNTEWSALFEN